MISVVRDNDSDSFFQYTFDEQLFIIVISGGVPWRRIGGTAKMQPSGQRPAAIVIAATTTAAKLVVVFQTLDRVAFNLALHDRPVSPMTTRTQETVCTERPTTTDTDDAARTLHTQPHTPHDDDARGLT